MLRVWMLLVVGAAAMRQVAEDVSAHSVKEESVGPISFIRDKWQTSRLRSAVKEVAKKNFAEEEGQDLTEAVMKAFENGELDKGLKEMSWEEKQRYLLTAMQTMRQEYLRRAVEEVAKKNFPEKEGQDLTEAVMKAIENGELDKGLKEMSWEEKQRYLLTAMQTMREDWRKIRKEVANVARQNFPEKEGEHLREAVMKAFENGELDKDWHFFHAWEKRESEKLPGRMSSDAFEERQKYLLKNMQRLRELPVAAAAVKFCSNLFREANSEAKAKALYERARSKASYDGEREAQEAEDAVWQAQLGAQEAAGICHKVLTGELGADDGPEWAEKAANSSQPNGQHYQLGRLQKVNATEKAWKVSLDNVCRDECQELVKEIQHESWKIVEDVQDVGRVAISQKRPSYEEACAKRVVQKVEAEILGCCAEKCGWNGRACMLWPFLNRTEKGQWEAECCTEFNILKNSSRAIMCDATLTGNENKKVIRDGQPNRPEDRRMIGQDPVLKGTSFLQGEEVNEPIPAPKGKCPPPLDLGEVHEKLKHQWKTTDFDLASEKFNNVRGCDKPPADTIGECRAFLPQGVDGGYACYGECLVSTSWSEDELKDLDATGNTGLLYVHEAIYNR